MQWHVDLCAPIVARTVLGLHVETQANKNVSHRCMKEQVIEHMHQELNKQIDQHMCHMRPCAHDVCVCVNIRLTLFPNKTRRLEEVIKILRTL